MHQNITGEAEVANRAVISVHTKPEVSERLGKLAAATRRSKSHLANDAIERYLDEEEAFMMAIEQGIADVKAGRAYTHDEARDRVSGFIQKRTGVAAK